MSWLNLKQAKPHFTYIPEEDSFRVLSQINSKKNSSSGAEDHFIQEGDIKVEIEPDINQMMSQYME